MGIETFDTAIRAWVVTALVAGIVLILVDRPLPTTIGVLLIIFGLLSFMPVVRNGMMKTTTD